MHARVHQVTDGLASFSAAGAVVAVHGAIILNPRQSSGLEILEWVSAFITIVNTAIRGIYHQADFSKYRSRYRAEAPYWAHWCFALCSLLDYLLWGCARAERYAESPLRLGSNRVSAG